MAFKQPYNNFNKQGASIAPAAAAAPAAVKGIGALLAKLGIGKAAAGAGSKAALSKGGSFLAKFGKGKASSLVGPTQPKQGFIKQASSKISKGYNQKISDLAKNLGENREDVDKFVKNKAMDAASNVVSSIGSKNEETLDRNDSEKITVINTPSVETKEPKLSGYGNPQGPSQGYSNPSGISKSDEALNVIKPKKDDFISNFHAPVTVKGITFDAGDAVRAGRLLYNTIKDRKTRSSRFKQISDKDIQKAIAKNEYDKDLKNKPIVDTTGDTIFSYSKKGKTPKSTSSKSTSKSTSSKPTPVNKTTTKPTSTNSYSKFYDKTKKRKSIKENNKRYKTNTKNLIAGKS